MYSCGIYKYEYKKSTMQIVAKKGNNITLIRIESEQGKLLAQFNSIQGKPSQNFSLKNFSPEYFKCMMDCPFTFEKGKIYLISAHPSGDRVSFLKIVTRPDGTIEEVN